MAKTRSPNYPGFNLGDAIERVRRIYRTEHTHPAEREVIARDLGYTSLNGASLTAIATITQYGLLEKAGENGLKVSKDAVTIIELPQGNPERSEAIKKAAFTPKLFSELHNTFGERLPGDENLRVWLIRKGFNQKATDGVIRVYRDNLELVTAETSGYNAGEEEQVNLFGDEPMQTQPAKPTGVSDTRQSSQPPKTPPALATDESELKFNISRDSQARVIFKGRVTQEAIEKLAAMLELQKDTFPTKDELEASRPAIWRNKDHDQPVNVMGEAGMGLDGKRYVKIEGSDTAIPEDELIFQS